MKSNGHFVFLIVFIITLLGCKKEKSICTILDKSDNVFK
jgi:hypothetical protein